MTKVHLDHLPKEIISGIYKVTSPSGRVYIGQSKNIYYRFNFYKNLHCKEQYLLFYSLRKYTPSNHTFEIIEECNEENMNIRERYWQDYFNVINGGLNLMLTSTTEKKLVYSLEVRKKMSLAKKGVLKSDEFKAKLKILRKDKRFSEYAKKMLILSQTGRPKKKESILKRTATRYPPVLQYTKQGEFIKEFRFATIAGKTLNIPTDAITSSIIGIRQQTAGGFVWRYKKGDEIQLNIEPNLKVRKFSIQSIEASVKAHSIPLQQLNDKGEEVCCWTSAMVASNDLNISYGLIAKNKDTHRLAGGYYWRTII